MATEHWKFDVVDASGKYVGAAIATSPAEAIDHVAKTVGVSAEGLTAAPVVPLKKPRAK